MDEDGDDCDDDDDDDDDNNDAGGDSLFFFLQPRKHGVIEVNLAITRTVQTEEEAETNSSS